MTGMTVEQALAIAGTWTPTDESPAQLVIVLRDELERVRGVIREYVNEVESGEKFDALVSAVPGLTSDGGMFGATCADCGEAITDERPSGETEAGPVHFGCGDDAFPCSCVDCVELREREIRAGI